VPRIITTAAPDEPLSPNEQFDEVLESEKTYYNSDSSGAATPEEKLPRYAIAIGLSRVDDTRKAARFGVEMLWLT
jgi:hypothetical protein